MPPPDSGHALTDKQIELLTRWIDEGAKWDTHWAFTRAGPPRAAGGRRRPAGRAIRSTSSSSRGSSAKACKPSPEADKVTLLRRVTYDLTGLPPTPAEIDAFPRRQVARRLREARRRAARVAALRRAHGDAVARRGALRRHARLPHRQPARHVALARLGHQRLQPQPAVRSVRRSSSSPATCCRTRRVEQKIASGFNRNHMINFEGGAIAEEYQVEYVVDRVEATSSAFMGLTMGCARCHDAQVRPDHAQGVLPVLRVLQQRARKSGSTAAPATPRRSCRCRRTRSRRGSTSSMRRSSDARAALADTVVAPLQARVGEAARRHGPADRRQRRWSRTTSSTATSPTSPAATSTAGRSPAIRRSTSARSAGRVSFDGDTEVSFGNVGAFDRDEPFSIAVWLSGRGNLPMAGFQKLRGPSERRGYEWRSTTSCWSASSDGRRG